MKYIGYLSVFVFLVISCTSKPLSSKEIALKCQEHHDTEGRWYDKAVVLELESKSIFSNNNAEHIHLKIDNKANTFEYHNLFREVHLEFRRDTCIAYNDNSNCENYEWASRFYPYIWGMHAKFFDPGIQIKEAYEEALINKVPVYVIHIDYEKENWDFYIDKSSFYLAGFKFVKKDNSGGEIVYNEGSKNVNGTIMPIKRTWYDLDMKLLGTDILK